MGNLKSKSASIRDQTVKPGKSSHDQYIDNPQDRYVSLCKIYFRFLGASDDNITLLKMMMAVLMRWC